MRNKCIILPVLLIILSGSFVLSKPTQKEMLRVNRLAEQGKFSEVHRIYLDWVRLGYKGKLLYYNIGVLYEKKGDVGNAMYYLKKAQKLVPNDDLVEDRLRELQEKIKDRFMLPIENEGRFDIILKPWAFFTPQKAGIFLLIGLWIYFIHFLYFRVLSVPKKLSIHHRLQQWQLFILLFLIIQCIRIIHYRSKPEAIILSGEVKIYQGADRLSPIIQTVHAGLPVLFEDKIGGWVKISLINGQTGWIDKSQLSAII
jgi:tetratricopeptide (TPR) repeat protein